MAQPLSRPLRMGVTIRDGKILEIQSSRTRGESMKIAVRPSFTLIAAWDDEGILASVDMMWRKTPEGKTSVIGFNSRAFVALTTFMTATIEADSAAR